METSAMHELARTFISALPTGELPDEIIDPALTVWTNSSEATVGRARFLGAIALLSKVSNGSILYKINSLTAENNRVVAEVSSSGTLVNGEVIANSHVFVFTINEGRVVAMREYMNPIVVREKIAPLMQQFMASSSAQ